jgi:hypothetical protein
MSGGGKTTGTTTSSIQGMSNLMGNAQSVMNSGTAFAPYTASTVTPFSSQTTQGMNGMMGTANDSQGAFNNQFNNVTGLTQDGGLNDLQDQQVGRMQSFANGDRLKEGGNPYLDDLIKRSGDDIRYQSGLSASSMGRYGSGGHEGVQSKAIGDMAGNLRYGNYEAETGRQMDAIGSLFNAGTQQRQNVASGTQQLNDAYQAKLSPYNTMMQVGAKNEDLYSRQLADQERIFREKQNSQTAPINWMANLLGAGQGGQTAQSTSDASSAAGRAAGGAIAGYGTFGGPLGALFGAGSSFL